MKDSGIPKYVRRWYYNLLTNRNCECTLGNITIEAILNSGIPQGAVLSPPVGWNPSMDKLVIILDAEPIDQAAFADDEAVIAEGDTPEEAFKKAQKAINKCVEWAEEHGLRFSASKTVAMLLTTKRKFEHPPNLQLYGEDIKYVDQAKYLGITVDNSLSWDKHIKERILSTKKVLARCKAALSHAWGPHPKYLKWLWCCVLRPRITYGSFVWAKATEKRNIRIKLRSIQRYALLMIAPVRHSTPTRALEIIYNIIPLHLQVRYLALATYVRINARILWQSDRLIKGHIEYAHNYLPPELRDVVLDVAPFERDWNLPYEVVIGDGINDDWTQGDYDFTCFTDGSLLEGESGSGVTLYERVGDPSNLGEKPEGATVYQAEVWAIEMATTHLIERGVSNSIIRLYVDNQAALRSMASVHSDKITVKRARLALKCLGLFNKVTLIYQRAHRKGVNAASQGNELADAAAREATKIAVESSISAPMALATAKSLIKSKIWAEWKRDWDWYGEARQSHYFLDGPSSKFNLIYKYSRTSMSRLVQYITGHAFLRRHNKIVEHGTKDHSDLHDCRLCGKEEETPHHLITKCEVLTMHRYSLFGRQELDTYFHSWKVPQMLWYLDQGDFYDLELPEYDNLADTDPDGDAGPGRVDVELDVSV